MVPGLRLALRLDPEAVAVGGDGDVAVLVRGRGGRRQAEPFGWHGRFSRADEVVGSERFVRPA